MAGKISALILATLCALFSLPVLLSEVNAKTTSHSSHRTSHGYSGSHSYPPRPAPHPQQSHSYGVSTSHGYSPPNSLSGNGSPSRSAAYPAPKLGSLSGSTGYGTSAHVVASPGFQLQNSAKLNMQSSAHGYPPANQPGSLSGGGSSGYPVSNVGSPYPSANFGSISASNGHAYPNSKPGSLSGGGSPIGQSNVMSNSGRNFGSSNYPSKTGHSYPSAGPGSMSGGGSGGFNYNHNSFGSSSYRPGHTVVHHHYVYRPPTVIHYGAHGISYPVYAGPPPAYVYEYRSSGNKYSHLLAGLALYNLGRISASSHSHRYHEHYVRQPGEICSFIVQNRRNYEEMEIDCRAITYFIYEDQPQRQSQMTNVMMPNGALVDLPAAAQNPNVNNGIYVQDISGSGVISSQPLQVQDPRFRGNSVVISSEMQCYVTRKVRYSVSHMKKQVPCDLLQTYSTSSLRGSGTVIKPLVMIFVIGVITAML